MKSNHQTVLGTETVLGTGNGIGTGTILVPMFQKSRHPLVLRVGGIKAVARKAGSYLVNCEIVLCKVEVVAARLVLGNACRLLPEKLQRG